MYASNELVLDNCLLPSKIYHKTFQLITDEVKLTSKLDNPYFAIERVLAMLEECLFLNMGRVLLPDQNQKYLRIRYAHGLPTEKRFITYKIDEGITGMVYETGQALYADDLDTNNLYVGRLSSPLDLPYSKPAFSGVPIKNQEDVVIGVLCVNHGYRNAKEISTILTLLEGIATIIAQLLVGKK